MAAWIWWTSGGMLALVGLWTLWWSLWRDRSRGRRRCPRCWYDMAGVPGLTCPECGRAAKAERVLFRTRRRWIPAIGALCAFAAGLASLSYSRVRSHGVVSLAPTSLLLRLSPEVDAPPKRDPATGQYVHHPIYAELERRNAQADLTDGQWRWLIEHRQLLQMPERWPIGEPVLIRMEIPRWFDLVEVRASASAAGSDYTGHSYPPARIGKYDYARAGQTYSGLRASGMAVDWFAGYRPFPLAGREMADVDQLFVGIYTGRRPAFGPTVPLWRGELPIEIEFVDDVSEVFRIEEGEDWDKYMRTVLAVETDVDLTRPYWSAYVSVRFTRGGGGPIDDMAVGLSIEVLKDGESIASDDLWSHELAPRWAGRDSRGFLSVGNLSVEDRNALVHQPERWVVRVTGVPRLALTDFDRRVTWRGSIDVPLRETLQVTE